MTTAVEGGDGAAVRPGREQPPLRVAFIGLRGVPAQYSGIEKAVEQIGSRLADRGHHVTVYCMAGRYRERPGSYRGMHLRYFPSIATKNLEMITYAFLSTLASLGRHHDITHFQALGPSTLAFIPRLLGRATITTVHALDWRNRKWGRFATTYLRLGEWTSTHCANATIAVSRQIARYLEERTGRDVLYIPNGTSPTESSPLDQEVRERFGIEHGRYLLFVGRITKDKHIHVLIEAFRGLDTDLKLLIVGGTTDISVDDLRKVAAGDHRVVFAGPIYGDVLDQLYSNAYLFVLPSILEGLPLVLLEAMTHATPVLASDIPENLEVISSASERAGFTFRAGDVDDLRSTLHHLLENPEVVARMGEHGRRETLSRYDWDRITDEVLAVYRATLDRVRPG
jgi:glycosyltransferase involved in cell wall biosynthesis